METLDVTSIRALELHAPGACQDEAHTLHNRVQAGEIFGEFSTEKRQILWSNICSLTVDCLVPSLLGFFDDLKHLKLAADCMKRLVHLEEGATLRSTLYRSFREEGQENDVCMIQTGSLTFSHVQGPKDSRFAVAYRVLWLYAQREHDQMPAEVKKKLAGANKGQINERILFEFASVAAKLGFDTKEIQDLTRRNPDRDIARRLLLTARGPDCFKYHDLEGCITEVAKMIKSARALHDPEPGEKSLDGRVKPPQKSGKPNWEDARRDKPYLFLNKLHAGYNNVSTLTSFFVFRSTYFAFFGKELGIDVTATNAMYEERLSAYIGELPTSNNPDQVDLSRVPCLPSRIEQVWTEEEHRQSHLRHQVDEQQAYLQNQRQTVARLNNDILEQESRLAAARHEEKELQEKLNSMRREEAEQSIRLGNLNVDEERRKTTIIALEQTKDNLGEEIRLDKIATGQKHQASKDEAGRLEARVQRLSEQESQSMKTLEHLDAQTAEKEAILQVLIATESETNILIEQLAMEEQRLKGVVAELKENARQRRACEQTEGDSWRTKMEEAQFLVQQLVEKEVVLQGKISQLQASIEHLTKEEKELQAHIEGYTTIERAHQLESLITTTAAPISFTDDDQSWTSSVSSPEPQNQASAQTNITQSQVNSTQPAPNIGLETMIRTGLDSQQEQPSQSARLEQGEASSTPQV